MPEKVPLLYSDNIGVLTLVRHSEYRPRTKHIPLAPYRVLSGHGHFSDGKILAVFGNPVVAYNYSIEGDLWKQLRSTT